VGIELWEAVAAPSTRYPSCHCSVITELDNCDLLVGYYAGTGEAKPDAAWVLARKTVGEDAFGPLLTVAESEGKPEGNGILFQDRSGKVGLVYNTMQGRLDGRHGPGVRWRTCDLRVKTSADRGVTWSDVNVIDAKWGNVPRCKPIRLQSGHLIFGTEYDDGHSRFWISEDDGGSWRMTGPVLGERNQHPSLIERADGSLLAFLRPSGSQGSVLQTESFDGGNTWSAAIATDLPSPFAALDAVKLADGRVVVAWNSNPKARNPLTLAMSDDEGETWSHRRDLVTGEGSFHYPALIQTLDGLLHVTFTNNRETIDHIALTVDWITGDGEDLPVWEGSGRRVSLA
jgi:predicted neuraminidase